MAFALELHDQFVLCGLDTLLLIVSDFEPLTRVLDFLTFAVVENLVLRIDQVNANVHKFLIVICRSSIKAILAVEEVLIALRDLPLVSWLILINNWRDVGRSVWVGMHVD